jgi:uncharacterized CHY-type Zn-finger protein
MENALEFIFSLPNNEGGVYIAHNINLHHTLTSYPLIHQHIQEGTEYRIGCGGTFKFITVSENKTVMVCDNCHLRHEIPHDVITLKQLMTGN